MAASEYHVASYVVRTRPAAGAHVARRIDSMPGLEVHAEEQGKLVVTAEARGVRELAEIASDLMVIESVLAVDPVYHEYAGANDTPDNPES